MDWNDSPESAKKYDPTEEDFRAIAKKKIIVIPTLSVSKQYSYERKSDGTFELNKERHEKVLARQKRLVKMMVRTHPMEHQPQSYSIFMRISCLTRKC